MISVLAFPVVFLLNLEPVVRQIVATLSFAFAGYATIVILFGPKVLALVYYRTDLDGIEKGNKVSPEGELAKASSSRPVIQGSTALNKMTSDQRVAFIKKQMEEWGVLLMKEIETNTSNDKKDLNTNNGSNNNVEIPQ